MTSKERFRRAFMHQSADRVPITDVAWKGTVRRWKAEGMPDGADWEDYFGIDKIGVISADFSPRYQQRVLEETEDYVIKTTEWGVTLKEFKEEDSTPEFLDFKIRDASVWSEAKKRMGFDMSRFDAASLEKNYRQWREEGRWIRLQFWFGFDVAHSWMTGTETLLIALLEEPEWVKDIFNTYLESNIAHFEKLLSMGYEADEIFWYDDMGYKNTTFFSLATYRELLAPCHGRAVQWAHDHGMYAHLHSCGYIMPFVDDLVAMGVDALNPLEVKAGMDPRAIKRQYGDRLVLHGGFNAMNWENEEKALREIEELLPELIRKGGYIFSSDHSIPSSVSCGTYKSIIRKVKEISGRIL